MNETQNTFSCDPARVEAFLVDALDAAEESALMLHLDQCDCCRELIQQAAADVATWNELESALKDEPYDSVLLGNASGIVADAAAPHASSLVNHVLGMLAPTDDPAMLGRLGPYEISGVIGSGGMGVVLKGHDRSLDRTIAIKVLAPHLASSGAAKKRFSREARAAAAVLHPNVIAIHSVSNNAALPYLVMPYVRGASLQKRIDSEGPLPLVDILRIGAQIAAGLAAAHAQGLVHRDIKPANIMLEDGVERVAITDFGLARAVDDATMTRSGVIAGTPQYMSPEQSRGEPVDPRSDLFSLGSVLYATCTGRPPFRAESTYGVIRRITEDEPTLIREINPDIPEWLCPIIVKLMSKQPDARFASASEVARLLEECLAHVQQPATVPLPESCLSLCNRSTSLSGRTATMFRRSSLFRTLVAVGVAGLLILAGVVIVLELNKGKLTIMSEADDVPIRIVQGDKVVERLTITRSGKSIRVAAGHYIVEIEGNTDGLTVEDGVVELQRGGNAVARIVTEDHGPAFKHVGNGIGVPLDQQKVPATDNRLESSRGTMTIEVEAGENVTVTKTGTSTSKRKSSAKYHVEIRPGDERVSEAIDQPVRRALTQEEVINLKQRGEALKERYQAGEVEFDSIARTLASDVLEAELQLALSAKERVAILERQAALLQDLERALTTLYKAGKCGEEDILAVRADRAEVEKRLAAERVASIAIFGSEPTDVKSPQE